MAYCCLSMLKEKKLQRKQNGVIAKTIKYSITKYKSEQEVWRANAED